MSNRLNWLPNLAAATALAAVGTAFASTAWAQAPSPAKAPSAPSVSDTETVRALKQAGLDAYSAKQYALAIDKLQAYVRLAPGDAQAHRLLGSSLAELGQLEPAIAARRRATELDPKDSRNWSGLCWTFILAGQPLQARPNCERSLALDETNWPGRVNLGHTWLLAGDAAAAQPYYRDTVWRVGTEEELRDGPVADFDIFIGKGWEVSASKTAKAWFQTQWPRWQMVMQLTREDIRLSNAGHLQQALLPSRQAAQLAEEILGPEHAQTGVRLGNLSQTYSALGDLAQALLLTQRALAIAEKAQGPDHPETGTSLNNLAGLYESMGQYDKALPLYQRALAIAEKSQGPEHPSTGTSLNNLAALFRAMGQYDKALPLYQRALAIAEKAQGPDHPSTGTRLNNLAGLYRAMGQYDKALPLYQRALAIAEKSHGPEHPSTGTSLNNLAGLYQSIGQYDKALPLRISVRWPFARRP